MNTYTWQFKALDVYPTYQSLSNVVFQVHWILTANDSAGHIASAYGLQHIGQADVTGFIPYANLTSSVVQGWVEGSMGSELASVKSDLDSKIAKLVLPQSTTMSPPW